MAVDGYVRVAKHVGLRQAGALADALAALTDDPPKVADTLRRHHLLGLVRSLLREEAPRAPLPDGLLAALESRRPVQRVPMETLLGAFDEVRRALETAGVPVLLLKGFYFAHRLHGGLGRRPQYDVDVLVRPRDYRRARRVLRSLGFARRGEDPHSYTVVRGDVKIDLHRFLRWAPAYAVDEAALWSSAPEVQVGGLTFRTLSDDYTLMLLALGSFEDLGQGTGQLGQLLDLYLLLRQVDGTMDWDAFFARRARENVLGVLVNLLLLVTELFEARAELVRLSEALEDRKELRIVDGRAETLALLAAPRKSEKSLVWFGRIYPGSLTHYLLWFWWGGFPDNLGRLGAAWVRSNVRVARARWRGAG